MKKHTLTGMVITAGLILAGCAQEVVDQGPSPADEPLVVETIEEATPEIVPEAEAVEAAADETEMAEELVADETPAETEISALGGDAEMDGAEQEQIVNQTGTPDIEQMADGVLPQDSVAYSYIIRPNDYLTKIAFNEYGNPGKWQSIYKWNRQRIGDDPNNIYPYRDLDLFKPSEEIVTVEYEYVFHTVEAGENLWSIAGEAYSDERAWIIIFWDNEKLLSDNSGYIKPGMELKIRTQLW